MVLIMLSDAYFALDQGSDVSQICGLSEYPRFEISKNDEAVKK